MDTSCKKLRSQITQSMVLLFTVMAIVGTVFCANALAGTGLEDESLETEMSSTKAGVMKYALIAASVAFGLGAIGAGIAISHVGAAAMGAVAEKPQIAGQALIFVALAEGLVVFGFITALMILGKV
jgi:V/A-type H+-transporting ATPase subunit K